jgi:hypothetical protein
MLKFGRTALLFFVTGETNLRAVWPIYLTVALPAILALARAPFGLSPPLILRLGYTTSVAAFIARRVRNVDRLTRIRVGTADSAIPLLLMLSWSIEHRWASTSCSHSTVASTSPVRFARLAATISICTTNPQVKSPQGK